MKKDIDSLLLPWSELAYKAKPILRQVANEWKQLIRLKKASESTYHSFLAEHGHMFFTNARYSVEVISKLRFGAEFVSDFVILEDAMSSGLMYELIEIETPHAAPFTSEGIPSARLTRAIQQVRNWKKWISNHQSEAKKLFPSGLYYPGSGPMFSYRVIIGTRENTHRWLERRNDLSNDSGITIQSFDGLTDQIERRYFANEIGGGSEEVALPEKIRNELASPFTRALADPDWRELYRRSLRLQPFSCIQS